MLLIACPVSYKFSIDEPSVMVDHRIFGKYSDEHGEIYGRVDIVKSNILIAQKSKMEYDISVDYISTDSKESFSEKYVGHVSIVENQSFLNVRSSTFGMETDTCFYIYKADLNENDIRLTPVNNCWISRVKNSSELKSFLGRNLSNELLYGTEILIKRR